MKIVIENERNQSSAARRGENGAGGVVGYRGLAGGKYQRNEREGVIWRVSLTAAALAARSIIMQHMA